MKKPVVSVYPYEASPDTLARAIEEAKGFEGLKKNHRVLIKPNLVGWDPKFPIAPYGVYTTSRLVEDMVMLLREYGVTDITIGEGSAPRGDKKGDPLRGTRLIFSALGYPYLEKKYGVKLVDFFEHPFKAVRFEDVSLNMCEAVLETDVLINMPVLKTHNQAKLSLGLKNLKGAIDLKSRRLCHHKSIPLDYFCSLFVEMIPPALTVLDGIYGLEKGPYYLGTAHRMNAVVASRDPLAVDVVGAVMAGFEPQEVEHLSLYAKRHERSLALDALDIKGIHPREFSRPLKWDYVWREDNSGPRNWDRVGITGLRLPKYDQSICTGCSGMYNPLLMLLTSAYKAEPFEGMEVLTGKRMEPSPGFDRTILFGNCMIKKNRKDPRIREAVYIKGCPVAMEEIIGKLEEIGLKPDVGFFAAFREALAGRYDGNPDFDPEHYFMPGATGQRRSAS